jgi:hypothetical protein
MPLEYSADMLSRLRAEEAFLDWWFGSLAQLHAHAFSTIPTREFSSITSQEATLTHGSFSSLSAPVQSRGRGQKL